LANIYYSHSVTPKGILRAVLSSEEGRYLLKEHSSQYFGQQFPAAGQSPGVDFAVLRIFDGEMSEECRAGFYLFDEDVIRIEGAVHSCEAGLSLGA
jgi:hypothetical protein